MTKWSKLIYGFFTCRLARGRQKAYLMHFSSAKQSKTREDRVEKYIPMIMDGVGLND